MGDWIVVNKEWRELSYGKDPMIRAGVQIELSSGERYLIGDINMLGGVCDDCREFNSSTVVARYRVVVDEKDMKR